MLFLHIHLIFSSFACEIKKHYVTGTFPLFRALNKYILKLGFSATGIFLP